MAFLVSLGAFFGILFPDQESLWVQSLRIGAGSVFVLFLPGYFLTKAFFREAEIDILERVALSFALSISVVPLLTFYANLAGMPISAVNIYSIIMLLIFILGTYLLFFQKPLP